MLSIIFTSFLYCGTQKFTQNSRWGHMNTVQDGTVPCLSWLAMLCLMHSRIQFALLDARAHCWFIFNLLSSIILRLFSAVLLSSPSSATLYTYNELFHPKCRIWHLVLLNSCRQWLLRSLICQDLPARLTALEVVSSSSQFSHLQIYLVYSRVLHSNNL